MLRRVLGAAALAVVVAVLIDPYVLAAATTPQADFAVPWTASRLWWSGGDPSRRPDLIAAAPGPLGGPFGYPAWTLVAFGPLAALPWNRARALWIGLEGVGVVAGVVAWWALLPRRRAALGWAVAAACASALAPVLAAPLETGHVAALDPLALAAAVALARRRPRGGGALGTFLGTTRLTTLPFAAVAVRPRRPVLVAGLAALVAVGVFEVSSGQSQPLRGMIDIAAQVHPPPLNPALLPIVRDALGALPAGAVLAAWGGLAWLLAAPAVVAWSQDRDGRLETALGVVLAWYVAAPRQMAYGWGTWCVAAATLGALRPATLLAAVPIGLITVIRPDLPTLRWWSALIVYAAWGVDHAVAARGSGAGGRDEQRQDADDDGDEQAHGDPRGFHHLRAEGS